MLNDYVCTAWVETGFMFDEWNKIGNVYDNVNYMVFHPNWAVGWGEFGRHVGWSTGKQFIWKCASEENVFSSNGEKKWNLSTSKVYT